MKIAVIKENSRFMLDEAMLQALAGSQYEIAEAIGYENFINAGLQDQAGLVICSFSGCYNDLSKLREIDRYKSLPVLFILSGDEDVNTVDRTKGYIEDFINPGFDSAELLNKIQSLLRRTDIFKAYGSKPGVDKSFLKEANKVLLVDDDPSLLRLFEYNLTKAGFEVTTADNGREALDAALRSAPDIIVSDIMMPEMDGFEFRRSVLNYPELKSVPFVFLTAKGDEQDILEGYDLEIEDYIIKTAGPRVVVAKVTAIMKSLDRERKKLVSEIHQAADSLRAKVVPDSFPVVQDFEIKHWHQPYKGIPGGDFIDYIQLDEDNTAIILGDVMGKKWGAWYFAFAYAGYVRSAIRVVLQSASVFSPSDLMQKINESIYQDAKVSEIFATLSIVILNSRTKTALYTGAGDLPLVYKCHSASTAVQQFSKGLLLGFSPDGMYEDISMELDSGDCLFMFTDGIIESRNPEGEQFGSLRLMELIRQITPGEDPLEKIRQELSDFTKVSFEDDISLITLKML